MGGNKYYGHDTFNITASSSHGTGNSYYSSGWIGNKPNNIVSGAIGREFPIIGHIQTIWAAPWDGTGGTWSGEGSGNHWFTIETEHNIILYQSPAAASGSTYKVFPDVWYPPYSKIVVHADTGGTIVTIGGIITDV